MKKGQNAEHRYQEEGRGERRHCAKNHKKENEVLWPHSPHASITVPEHGVLWTSARTKEQRPPQNEMGE